MQEPIWATPLSRDAGAHAFTEENTVATTAGADAVPAAADAVPEAALASLEEVIAGGVGEVADDPLFALFNAGAVTPPAPPVEWEPPRTHADFLQDFGQSRRSDARPAEESAVSDHIPAAVEVDGRLGPRSCDADSDAHGARAFSYYP